jgi:hypothetical protein
MTTYFDLQAEAAYRRDELLRASALTRATRRRRVTRRDRRAASVPQPRPETRRD